MSSRMDKYTETPNLKSRTEKNKHLYENIKNSEIEGYSIDSNATVIEEDYNVIDVDKIRAMLDKRYRDSIPKRNIKLNEPEEEIQQSIHDTKEYDINAILEKAKSNQKIDYDRERLKKVHDTQYDILKKLDIKDNSEENLDDSEENLVNLINTITALEMKNREEEAKHGNTTALDLLNDLSENNTDLVYKTMELDKDELEKSNDSVETDLEIDENYEDFKELEKDLKSNNLAIKIVGIVFVIIIIIIAIIVLKKYI